MRGVKGPIPRENDKKELAAEQMLAAQVMQPELAPLWSLPWDTASAVRSVATAQLESVGLPAIS